MKKVSETVFFQPRSDELSLVLLIICYVANKAKEIASCIQGEKCESYQPFTGLPVIIKTQDCKAKSKASQKTILPVTLLGFVSLFRLFLRQYWKQTLSS